MKSKRVVKGNFTTIPTGAEIIGSNITNAVTEISEQGAGNVPLSSYESVLAAREFCEENQK